MSVDCSVRTATTLRAALWMAGALVALGMLSACNVGSGETGMSAYRIMDNPELYLNKTVRLERILCSEYKKQILCISLDENRKDLVCSGNEPYRCKKDRPRGFLLKPAKITASNPEDLAFYKENCIKVSGNATFQTFVKNCTFDVTFKLDSYESEVITPDSSSEMTLVAVTTTKIELSR